MKIIENNDKYVSSEVVQSCFEKGKINYVDKVVTGNGFTTGFGQLTPEFMKVNVLVAPNQSVVKDKEAEHKVGKFAPNKNVAFVYEGSGLRGSVNDYDLVVIVSDSFVNFAFKLQGKVDKLMVDEYHSVIIQSAFRYKLKKMMYTLVDDFSDVAVSFVTASPLLYSRIDIQIQNKYIQPRDLHTSNNVEESIARCVKSIQDGRKVLIFAQDSAIIKRVLKDSQRSNFRLIAGTSFTSTLLSKEVYKLDNTSNIVVCSSAAFEGWSDYSIDGDVFLYMNLGNSHNTFLGCNIYQAIGRLREGYRYAEACVTNLGGGGFPNKIIGNINGKIDKLISMDDVPIERKQSRSFVFHHHGHKVVVTDLIPYTYYKRDKNVYTIHKYKPAVDVHNEIKQIDTRLNLYESYFKTRMITLIDVDIDITQKRITSRLKREQRVMNICENIQLNNLDDNFMDFFFKSFHPEDKAAYYIEEIDVMQEVAYHLGKDLDGKFEILKQYLSNGYHAELKDLFIKSKQKKGWGRDKIRKELKSFNEVIFPYTIDVAVGIVFDRFDSYIVGHRDYNKLTMIGFSMVEFIASKMGLTVTEVDIKNCFPRILYALNGMELPEDFYGDNREKNKKAVNSAMNSFRFDTTKNRTESKQKADSRASLLRAGIDGKCVDWLINNHFNNKFKGDFFNYLAYHERCIISAAIDIVQAHEPDKPMYRRHDSFIVFSDINYKCLNDFEYLGQKGWFDSYEVNDEDFNEYLPF